MLSRQSPQQPRWLQCTNLLLSSAQGESWRSFLCFVPTSTSSHVQWKMIGSHEQAHLLSVTTDELMRRCHLSSMPRCSGQVDGSSEPPWDVWSAESRCAAASLRMCLGWVIDLGVLCGSAAGLAEEWIRALRMSSTRVPNPVGSAQPATSVAGPSFAGRSGHDRGTLAATPRRSDA